jgi:hypothetical protein
LHTHHISSVSFAVLADKMLQSQDHHQSLLKEINKTVTQFSPFSFITQCMVPSLPKTTGRVPFHSLVNMKHAS